MKTTLKDLKSLNGLTALTDSDICTGAKNKIDYQSALLDLLTKALKNENINDLDCYDSTGSYTQTVSFNKDDLFKYCENNFLQDEESINDLIAFLMGAVGYTDEEIKNKIKVLYVFDCLYTSNYDEETSTETETELNYKDTLQFIADHLRKEAFYNNNLHRFDYNKVAIIADHLQGLPSYFNMAFENYEILKIGKSWGYNLGTEIKEDNFLKNWFNMIAYTFKIMCNKAGVEI